MTMQIIGIREKLLIAFLGVTSIVLLVSGGVFFYIAQGLLKEQIYSQLSQAAISISTQIDDRLRYMESIVGEVVSHDDLRRDLTAADTGEAIDPGRMLGPLLEDAREAAPDILDLAVFSPEGQFLASARRNSLIDALPDSFSEDIGRQGISWRWQMRDQADMEVGYSITYENQMIGKLVAVIDPQFLQQLIDRLAIDDDLFDIIISRPSDKDSPIPLVTSRDIEIERPDMRLNPFANDGAFRFVEGTEDYRGERVLAVLTTLRDYPLGVTIKAEDDVVLEPLKEEKLTFLLLIVGSFALALLVTYILSAFLSRPILDMARIASLIASGDFERRISNFSQDELGLLGKALNQMGDQLMDMQSKLQKYFNEKTENIERLNKDLQATNEELQELSRTDPLTGLANRREFIIVLKREWGRARREGTWLAFCMIDVDCFKKFNDSLGHEAGDQALKRVAKLIKDQCRRATDLAVRLGGEEFGVLLPTTNLEQAKQLAEQIRQEIAAAGIAHPASDVADVLTLSIGVSAIVPEDHHESGELIKNADKGLYSAKHAGRNRVMVG